MNPLVENRMLAIQDVLMAHHRGGAGLPNDMIGTEREYLLNSYLREVLPPIYRFGSGAITDASGACSGALDLVMELPFGPNFLMPSGNERLYLAESVAVVIEVKSDLYKQWNEVERTVARVKKLVRDLKRQRGIATEDSPSGPEELEEIAEAETIPCYAVGYKGHKEIASLEQRLFSTEQSARPDGVLVIESGCFVGLTGKQCNARGLFAFVAELIAQVNCVLGIAYPSFEAYFQSDATDS